MPSWLTELLGPTPSPQVVSTSTKAPPKAQQAKMPQGFDINALLNNMTSNNDAANAAGLQRYQGLLSSVQDTGNQIGGLYGQAYNLAGNLGTSGQRQINDARVQNAAATDQNLTSRGLGQTTIRQSAMRGVNDSAQNATQNLNEQVAGMKSGILQNQAGAVANQGNLMANSILSRQDQTIDPSIYASLIQQLMASGGQMGNVKSTGGNTTGGGVAPRTTGAASSGGGGSGSAGSWSNPFGSSGGSGGPASHAQLLDKTGNITPNTSSRIVRNTTGRTTTGGEYKSSSSSAASAQSNADRPTRYIPMGLPVPTGAEVARSGAVGVWVYV